MNTAIHTPIVEDERLLDRAEIALVGELRTARGRRVAVTVRNVSPQGFMAEGGSRMVPGLAVTLALNGLELEARIVWNRSGHVGGSFVQPIETATLANLQI